VVARAQKKLRIAVGVSGSGRSLSNLLEIQTTHPFSVELVFSSATTAGANELAERHHIPLLVLDFGTTSRDRSQEILYKSLEEHKIDLVVLAGFLKLLPMNQNWQNKIINIHPSLLPKHGGKGMHGRRVHEAVVQSGDLQTGATVHFVNENYDDGLVIAQALVPITVGESPDVVAGKVFQQECRLLPAVIGAFADGRVPFRGVAQLNSQGELIEPT
jgi:phosphoribosylglycinamide formyltransferase 1